MSVHAPLHHAPFRLLLAGRELTLIGAGALLTLAVLGMLGSRDVRTLRHKLAEPAPGPMKESVP